MIQQLLHLCSLLDQLRKFVVINYVVVLKVLKKYEEYTHRNAKEEFMQEVESEPFFTSVSRLTPKLPLLSVRSIQRCEPTSYCFGFAFDLSIVPMSQL